MRPEYVIMHCSDSPWGDVPTIASWHRERQIIPIGYHYVVYNGFRSYLSLKDGHRDPNSDGAIERGRAEGETGAHCFGYNDRSIGVCLVGAHGQFTDPQFTAARTLVRALQAKYEIPTHRVLGHYETDSGRRQGKTCPTFDMVAFRDSLKDA